MKEQGIRQRISLEEIIEVLEIIQKASDSYFYVLDLSYDIMMVSQSAVRRFAFPSVHVENCSAVLKEIVHPDDYDELSKDIERCASGKQTLHNMEYRWCSRDKQVVWIECRGTVVISDDNHYLLVGRVREIGKKAKADNVTGLRKEVRFREDIDRILTKNPQAIKYCMRIGIDNFKEINEKDGLDAGDNILHELADCIIETVHSGVDIYRLVADEFMIVDACPESTDKAADIYQCIKRKVAEMVRKKEYTGFYTVSAGVLEQEEEFVGKKSEDILRLTEFALNEAKRNGRNQMALFDRNAYNEYLKRLSIRKAIRLDIANDFHGFQVFYQPIVDANTYKLIGAEALLRWKDEKYGNVSPAVFIPIMEESGLIIPVGRYVLWEAARTCKKWQKTIPDFHVNVNLSYVQIRKSDLMHDVDRCIKEVGIEPNSLVLELTESGYIETDSRIMDLFQELKEKNISLAIDDFGTGYSNMRYLEDISAKTVKIDRSFVLQALENEYDYTVIRYIIDMVHSIGSSVCMEGIEYEHELEKMKRANPDMIQGYLFGKPCSAEEFEEKYLKDSL
ncbi:MAG: GGDEF and EAL domain-containing protein [Lachnospiraceae bacterium]|nr:GGDEF and EAL domain-containing protein [Lachnospiraceae bacterium]